MGDQLEAAGTAILATAEIQVMEIQVMEAAAEIREKDTCRGKYTKTRTRRFHSRRNHSEGRRFEGICERKASRRICMIRWAVGYSRCSTPRGARVAQVAALGEVGERAAKGVRAMEGAWATEGAQVPEGMAEVQQAAGME